MLCWVVFGVTVGSSNFPRRFHPKVSKGPSGFNAVGFERTKFAGKASTLALSAKVLEVLLCCLRPAPNRAHLDHAKRGMICLNFTKGGLRRGASQN